ncbi:MAG: hypothetical protein AAF683_00160 [Pseudomonadota bacterium]
MNKDPKVRFCLIWRTQSIFGLSIVAVLPISASATGARVPIAPQEAIALGLPENSHVVTEEANIFTWPSPFVKRPGKEAAKPVSRKLLTDIEAAMRGRQIAIVRRAEAPPQETQSGAAQ